MNNFLLKLPIYITSLHTLVVKKNVNGGGGSELVKKPVKSVFFVLKHIRSSSENY